MNEKIFKFKQFSLLTPPDIGMPISTDGVLLGAWALKEPQSCILDIGTGSGLLALMCAQRHPDAYIEAVELDLKAFHCASHNFNQSPWSKRLHIHLDNILTFENQNTFSGIICNPPYFNTGPSSEKISRAQARHTASLSHSALLAKCEQVLDLRGYAAFILPIVEGEQFMQEAVQTGWFIKRCCRVASTETKNHSRIMLELTREPVETQLEQLVIRKKGSYSQCFTALTRDFYLKM